MQTAFWKSKGNVGRSRAELLRLWTGFGVWIARKYAGVMVRVLQGYPQIEADHRKFFFGGSSARGVSTDSPPLGSPSPLLQTFAEICENLRLICG